MRRRTRALEARVIGACDEQLGVPPIDQALRLAQDAGLDLVEVCPLAKPPVCKIMDYGRLRYTERKRETAIRKKQSAVQLKEIQLRPGTAEDSYVVKLKKVRGLLEAGGRVRITVSFRGREIGRLELGQKILLRVIDDVKEAAVVEAAPKLEGRHLSVLLAPAGPRRPSRPPGDPQAAALRSSAR
jgi:translation initiation factor IF-3